MVSENGGVRMLPCPFCEGPPVVIVQHAGRGGYAERRDHYAAVNGLSVKAFVFCHDCGCEGPGVDWIIDTGDEYDQAEEEAVRLWQQRDNRARVAFDSSEERGLNLYPRPKAA